ncbi:hypothetical protein GCM10011317_21620 [Niveispirillum cyanobacteriorum]|nr:hypothetical protein GCM10011317_21620 [Niveispirillum cyanobacteriorum]
MPPLSPWRAHVLVLPVMLTPSRENLAWVANTLPVRFWHSRQWHMDTRPGSP